MQDLFVKKRITTFKTTKVKRKEEMTMMSKITKALIVVWMVTVAFSTMAWADGAGPSGIEGVPTVREYPLIQGTFTVSYRKFEDAPKFFDIHVVLEGSKTYLIERTVSSESIDLCMYKCLTMDELIKKYEGDPSAQKVQKAFGFKGIPVITELKILESNDCDDKHKAMLYGTLKIRVLPFQN